MVGGAPQNGDLIIPTIELVQLLQKANKDRQPNLKKTGQKLSNPSFIESF